VDQSGGRERRDGRPSEDQNEPFLTRSAKSFQENVTRAGPAATASYTLIGAIMLLGAAGYALDRWLGTQPWFLIGGLLLGIAVGFNELIKSTRTR
jgi:F0F1-type ATP synthase assembly protein I